MNSRTGYFLSALACLGTAAFGYDVAPVSGLKEVSKGKAWGALEKTPVLDQDKCIFKPAGGEATKLSIELKK
jgi:hypothetical protein